MHKRLNVMVVFGGMSSEHGVSCLTAANVLRAMSERFNPIPVGITPDGRTVRVDLATALGLAVVDGELPSVPADGLEAVVYRIDDRVMVASRDKGRFTDAAHIDAAFAVMHGAFGEDGTVQGMFEMWGLPYVGAGVTASAVSMDKIVMKQIFRAAGLPVSPAVAIHRDWETDRKGCLRRASELTFPVYVKPARAGSSIGISRVESPRELADAIEEARRFDPRVLVEQGVVGREIECAVLEGRGGARPRTSKTGEIVMLTDDKFYDFDAKYLPEGQVRLDIPARIDPGLEETIRHIAARTFEAVNCEGMARIDVFVTPDDEVIVNEINTVPGFTPYSMFPMLWQEAGMTYPDLIGELIELALDRPRGLR